MTKPERLLANVVRFGASVLFLAAFAVLLPFPFMNYAHMWLGMGALPELPIVNYLTRSLAALYAFHGAVLYLASMDVRRYGPLIALLAWGDIAFGLVILAIDAAAGMPWYWTMAEGPSLIAYALLVLRLKQRCGKTAASTP